MNKLNLNFIFALGGTVVYAMVILSLGMALKPESPTEPSTLHRVVVMIGGSFPKGIIQFIILFFFLYGLFVLLAHRRKLREEQDAFKMNLLPVAEQKIIKPEQVQEIKLKMMELERAEPPRLLVTLIKKTCTQYRNEGSISDTLQVLEAQVQSMKEHSQSEYEIVNYLSPGLPSLGFIGTVLGLSGAMRYFNQSGTDEGLALITDNLYVAFDCTFFALSLGVFFNYYFNRVQEEEQRLYASVKSYVIDNLVSRIYHGGVRAGQVV